jgi:hypothetical protein
MAKDKNLDEEAPFIIQRLGRRKIILVVHKINETKIKVRH